MTNTNRICLLKERPTGMVGPQHFEVTERALGPIGDGEVRVEVACLSLDPAMRGWISPGKSYVPPVPIDDVMRAIAAGRVTQSNHKNFAAGDFVTGMLGVQTIATIHGSQLEKVDPEQAPLERWIGGLGMPGKTAYFGLLELGQPKEGETVVVSAASGAVGSVVGQIAKIKGARAVGIAGGAEKCRYVTEELGFDACVDYKAGNLVKDLKKAAPKGIDVYFENVGGEIGDAVFGQMNRFGRVPVCGLISAYNSDKPVPGPYNFRSILVSRLMVRGFIVFDFLEKYAEATAALGQWHAEGKIKLREDVREGGVDAFPSLLPELYTGGNNGKLVLRV